MSILDRVVSPTQLKRLPTKALPGLCSEIRRLIIDVCAHNGGHLGGNLGAVELIVSLHRVFNYQRDKFVFDVGHQAYTHKILTGRYHDFATLRQKNGLAPFPLPAESEADSFIAGHAGNSVSAALGLSYGLAAHAWSIAVIGDGSLANGMVFEALNHLGTSQQNVLVIINDNGYTIDKTVGALATEENYRRLAQTFNLPYHFLASGHDISKLSAKLKELKKLTGPQILHIKTVKGCGDDKACQHKLKAHTISANFGKISTELPKQPYQKIVVETLLKLAAKNRDLMVVTPAMGSATNLNEFAAKFPHQFFDVGIAEEHAVTFAAGLAAAGKQVFCHLYSTFAQRAFDQLIHDVALPNLPVTFLIDRAGIVGEDGATHQGIFDLSFFSSIPNFVLAAPQDARELAALIKMSPSINAPLAIRYPRAALEKNFTEALDYRLVFGRALQLRNSKKKNLVFLTTGSMSQAVKDLAGDFAHYHFPFVKPLDKKVLRQIARTYQQIITVEENVANGGFGAAVSRLLIENFSFTGKVKTIALPDQFVFHAPRATLLDDYGLSSKKLAKLLH